jgi:hypothetical protein
VPTQSTAGAHTRSPQAHQLLIIFELFITVQPQYIVPTFMAFPFSKIEKVITICRTRPIQATF